MNVKAENKNTVINNDEKYYTELTEKSGKDSYINPIYKNYKISIKQKNKFRTYTSSEETYTWDEAVKYYRNKINARENLITFTLEQPASEAIASDEICQKLFDAVCSENNSGKNGDYIRYSVYGWNAQWRMETTITEDTQMILYHIQLGMNYFTTADEEKSLDQKISEVEQSLQLNGASDFEKIKKIYKYIEENVTYDYDGLDDANDLTKFSAYGALVDKNAVCQGYASLLYRMLEDYDIDSRIITSDTLDHAWNIAKLNGLYYYADSTWDSNIYQNQKQISYKYFLKGNKDFEDHEATDSQYKDEVFAEQYPLAEKAYNNGVEKPNLENDDFEVTLDDGELTITSYKGSSEDVVVPAKINGYKVKKIAQYAFKDNKKIKKLIINEGIEELTSLFVGQCENLQEISIPSTAKLVAVGIGTGVDGFVDDCTSLREITVPKANPYLTVVDGVLYNKKCTDIIACPSRNRNEIINIPEGVTYIRGDAFAGNKVIKKVILPDSVTHIGYWAFNNCRSLCEINIPPKCKLIGQYAFQNTAIKKIKIPAGVKEGICNASFRGTTLETIEVEDGNPYYSVKDGALYAGKNCILLYEAGSKREEFKVEEGVTYISWCAFMDAKNLKKITLSSTLTEIGYAAFSGCENLEELNVETDVLKEIGELAFADCQKLKKIILPDSVENIAGYAFYHCCELKEFTIPSHIKK